MTDRRRFLAAGCAVGVLPRAFAQQDYPNRPVRVVNPYAPGGSSDPALRPVTTRLQQAYGQNFLIENRGGAGTNIGNEIVAKAKPDGYTLLMGTSSLAINPTLYRSLAYDPVRDLQPITLLTNIPNALAVNASLPVRTVAEFIRYARDNAGKLNYSSSGVGGTNHLGMELLKSQAGLDIVHVPYKGGGPALVGLLGNEVQVMLSPITAFLPHEQAGKLRILGVASARRVQGVDVPTVAEAASLPGYESGVWMALFAPAGTPRAIVDRLSADVNRLLRQPDLLAEYERVFFVPGGGSPEDLARLLRDDTERLGRLIRSLGLAGSEGAKA